MNSEILLKALERPGKSPTVVAGAPEGMDAVILSRLARQGGDIIFVARDDVSMSRMAAALQFFDPDLPVLKFPAWDCLPYDRVSPRADIESERIDTLTRLIHRGESLQNVVVLTTVSAFLQRVPPSNIYEGSTRQLTVGDSIDVDELGRFLEQSGYQRVHTVMEAGEFAVRGGIVDVFPSGLRYAYRLDFFGNDLDGIRLFDPVDQRTVDGQSHRPAALRLIPAREVLLTEQTISRFRSAYRVIFGSAGDDDPLYEAVSEGRRYAGAEHWLPLFYDTLETLVDYLPGADIVFDHQVIDARSARFDLIAEYFTARQNQIDSGDMSVSAPPYRPVPPDRLFVNEEEWNEIVASHRSCRFYPFSLPDEGETAIDAAGRGGTDFADARVRPEVSIFDAVRDHVDDQIAAGRRVVVVAFSEGSRDRLQSLLREHGVVETAVVAHWRDVEALSPNTVALAVIDLERGFVGDGMCFITEQDILGERLVRQSRRKVKAENFIAEASALNQGDLVVHVDHGIGRFESLESILVGGAPHDCLKVVYAGNDKLFLPVENIEVLSRYGSEAASAQLDKLGGAAWQSRKASMKARIREMADQLIGIAAARELKRSPPVSVAEGPYDEFCARFPYPETEDQARAISEALDDLTKGRPADRLVCGDVGFGKTEIALRAAFAVAMEGRQVAIVVPTTLLCRQHFQTFQERFSGFPIRVEQVSRMVSASAINSVKSGLSKGQVDIVIGTHALLAKDVKFSDLGLIIVDEEQHFGVSHKEKLKALKSDVHVLTLTATPIPRTLQMALTGIREMSLIATPPVDRLAVRTYVMPFDPVIVREAILRERFRGGQTFYVCPRIADIEPLRNSLHELVPEVKIGVAHGRLSAGDLEKTIGAFYEGAFDVLLSTNIVESGLDLPSVNTIIIHRSDKFGLAQLYQLRGRVGRSKTRAYAYLTLPPDRKVSVAAEKRLEVMQTLDTLGAGFSLASHDLDIRGAGNLLGDEQSGHIREVGIELYQQMLEEAVAEARGGEEQVQDEEWSPQIAVGLPVMIPENYVADLTVRMGLYRRLAWLHTKTEIEAFAAEMIDRFGALPDEVENLLDIVTLKNLCKEAGVSKVDAGPKGAVVTFRNDHFVNPAGLVAFITTHQETAKLRPDHKLVLMRNWANGEQRIDGVRYLVGELVRIAKAA